MHRLSLQIVRETWMEALHLPLLIVSFSFTAGTLGDLAPNIYEPPSVAAPSPPAIQTNVTLVLVAGMIVCVTIFFLTYFIAYKTIFAAQGEWNQNFSIYGAARRRNMVEEQYRSEDGEEGAIVVGGEGLEASLLSSFPIIYYSSAMASTCDSAVPPQRVLMKECAVCLCEFEEGEEMKLLPVCGHSFHKTCIDRWLFSHTTCPICRLSLHRKHAEEDKQVPLVQQPSASTHPPHVALDLAFASSPRI